MRDLVKGGGSPVEELVNKRKRNESLTNVVAEKEAQLTSNQREREKSNRG